MSENTERRIIQTLLLLLAVSISFILGKGMPQFTLQVIAFLLACYTTSHFLSRKINAIRNNKTIIDFLLITLAVYTIIFSTGDLFSPAFFLIYFLLFGVTLLFEPFSALLLATISTVFFLLTPQKGFWLEAIQLGSIFLISPLALIFGNQYLKLQEKETEVEILKKEEKILASEVVSQEKAVREWTFGEFRNQLIKIWENLEKISRREDITKGSQQKLTEISNQLSNLLKSAQTLEKKISK